jgi:aldose 1-epimerase
MVLDAGLDAALRPLAPGPLLEIRSDALTVQVAPAAGGRIAQIAFEHVEWLCGHDSDSAAIAWGCYPMLPWAGRIRQGRFRFDGHEYQLPANLGAHAIHGIGFVNPWRVEAHSPTLLELSLRLPCDKNWPFGGTARQRFAVEERMLQLELSVRASEHAMPHPVLGWHPWFIKPEAVGFRPTACYPRDAQGIATLPLTAPPAGPWDDCFTATRPVTLHRAGQVLCLTSSCDHWVVFDERAHATCMEPQSGPPDAFNLDPSARLEPGDSAKAWFVMEWQARAHRTGAAADRRSDTHPAGGQDAPARRW